MDKLYFDGSDTGVSKTLRAEYSRLTNVVLLYLDNEREFEAVKESLDLILRMQNLTKSPEVQELIKSQLRGCSFFWEDHSRFTICWPVIKKLIEE